MKVSRDITKMLPTEYVTSGNVTKETGDQFKGIKERRMVMGEEPCKMQKN